MACASVARLAVVAVNRSRNNHAATFLDVALALAGSAIVPDRMVVVAFTSEPDAALLPTERERLEDLVDRGVLRAAYLSADRSEARHAMGPLPPYPHTEILDSIAR